jgi:large subunit ribosomal protein L4e
MKTKILTIDGKSKGEINLPKDFSSPIREDIVQKVLEIKKNWQPYGPNPLAGNYSASGKINHRRHVWKSQYGRGISRIPRKIFSRRGSQFNWEGADIPSTRGGRRAHPPKSISMINTKKINKKEMKIAFESALSATANKKFVEKKYERIEKLDKNIPFVIDSKIIILETKDFLNNLKKILGEKLFEIAKKRKGIRSGIGRLRGRKYKRSAGALIVVGENEKFKTSLFDVVNVKNLSVNDLAKGGLGRLVIYTENAIKFLEKKK